jgi:hypothetical protein
MKKEIIKPFDLEAYKNGAKVKTRDGHEVRIICTDSKCPIFPIVALVKTNNDKEVVISYTYEGKSQLASHNINGNDLIIVEEVEEPEFWSDNKGNTFNGFRINNVASISEVSNVPNTKLSYDVFAIKKQAKSALAMARISQIMANDIKNFGGVVTDEEWEDNYEYKFAIYRVHNNISVKCARSDYQFLAFHTAAQRDLFLEMTILLI